MAENDVLENVLDPVGQPSGIFGRISDPTSKNTGVVLDPYRQPRQELSSMEGQLMAPRLDSLEGKVVYLVETGFHGAKDFMDQAAGWFSRNMPAVKIESRSTQGSIFTTTDFTYTQTVSVDKWIPKKGICFDEKPIRMPLPVTCKDGSCGIR